MTSSLPHPPPATLDNAFLAHFLSCAFEDSTEKKQVEETLPHCLKQSWKCFETPSGPQYFSLLRYLLTSFSVHILKLANEKENGALLIYLSYGNEFSASKIMLVRRGCTRSVKHWTNMHQTWQVLFWPSAFAVNFLNSTQWDLKNNISSAHQFYCFIILAWQQLNVLFVLFLHMPLHLYLQIIIYITSFNFL